MNNQELKDFLENLVLDEHREAFEEMTPRQKAVVRFAFIRGKRLGTESQGGQHE